MHTMSNLHLVIFFLGASQGLFLAVLLFQKRDNRHANRFLVLLMLCYSLYLLRYALHEINILSISSNRADNFHFSRL